MEGYILYGIFDHCLIQGRVIQHYMAEVREIIKGEK